MTRYLITSALPYINGIKHLGNLIGSLLPADVYARFLRQQGETVLFICGTDEHGTPAELAAEKAHLDVATYCEKMYETQRTIYKNFHIAFDYFGRSSASENHALTQSIFQALDKNHYIEIRDIQQFYSETEKRFLPDRYVEGTCPHCQYNKARGDQCESCGRLLDPTELLDPHSALSGSRELTLSTSQHIFLKLSELEKGVASWVKQHDEWSTVTKGIAQKWLKEGLQSRCISRDLSWGVHIPKPGFENKVFYVWFDAPIAYISMTQAWATAQGTPEAWRSWWEAGNDVYYSQFMAKDNIPFHAIFWPAVLMGAKQNWKLVDDIKGFNWLTYEGGKFSTSQSRGVFTDTALALFPADYWRYYLLANAPESSDSDFTFTHFAATINKDLADILGNFTNRVTTLLQKYFDSRVPAISYKANETLQIQVKTGLQDIDKNMRHKKFRQSLQQLRQLWVLGNEYITEKAPWKLAKTDLDRTAAVLIDCLHLLRIFAISSSAFLPETASHLANILNLDPAIEKVPFLNLEQFDYFKPNHLINTHNNLFEKITEEQVNSLTLRFAGE